jgi:hypothetical protein
VVYFLTIKYYSAFLSDEMIKYNIKINCLYWKKKSGFIWNNMSCHVILVSIDYFLFNSFKYYLLWFLFIVQEKFEDTKGLLTPVTCSIFFNNKILFSFSIGWNDQKGRFDYWKADVKRIKTVVYVLDHCNKGYRTNKL